MIFRKADVKVGVWDVGIVVGLKELKTGVEVEVNALKYRSGDPPRFAEQQMALSLNCLHFFE